MPGLYLHDPEFDAAQERIVAKGKFGIDRDLVIAVNSWQGLATEIKKRAAITNLVLAYHGSAGGMTVGDENRDLNEPAVVKLFDKAPKIDKISFINCRVGIGPTKMRDFAKLFKATSISAYTWWLVKQPIKITMPRGTDEATIRKTFEPFVDYNIDMTPAPTIVRTQTQSAARDYNIVVMYGSSDQSFASKFPIPFGEGKDHKSLKQAAERSIKASEADALEKEYDNTPSPFFELVTITL